MVIEQYFLLERGLCRKAAVPAAPPNRIDYWGLLFSLHYTIQMVKLLFSGLFWRTTCLGVALAKTEVRGILSPRSG